MRFPGQGNPLPQDSSFKGQWLVENVLFLYEPGAADIDEEGLPRLSRGYRRPDGEWCTGFNSEVIARRLGVDSARLFEANRSGELMLTVEDAVGCVGSGGARRYVFDIGEASAGLVTRNA